MRVVIQRVIRASVTLGDADADGHGEAFEPQFIGRGLVLLVGVADADGEREVAWLARKVAHMRLFADDQGRMNHSVLETSGAVLSISQFTLFADVRHGNRPSFTAAGEPRHAREVWERFNEALREYGLPVRTGCFGAHMRVSLVNDGPVSIVMDTEEPTRGTPSD